ncbi:MAG TPA: septum formation initiator family protein, partial [Vulgatibacter sp.]
MPRASSASSVPVLPGGDVPRSDAHAPPARSAPVLAPPRGLLSTGTALPMAAGGVYQGGEGPYRASKGLAGMSHRRLIVFAMGASLAAVGLALDPQGLRHTRRLLEDLDRIEAENEELRGANAKLRMELRRLADDPAVLERVARE